MFNLKIKQTDSLNCKHIITSLILLFIFNNSFSQEKWRSGSECSSLKAEGEGSRVCPDNGPCSWCNVKVPTSYTRCMCEVETQNALAKKQKEERENREMQEKLERIDRENNQEGQTLTEKKESGSIVAPSKSSGISTAQAEANRKAAAKYEAARLKQLELQIQTQRAQGNYFLASQLEANESRNNNQYVDATATEIGGLSEQIFMDIAKNRQAKQDEWMRKQKETYSRIEAERAKQEYEDRVRHTFATTENVTEFKLPFKDNIVGYNELLFAKKDNWYHNLTLVRVQLDSELNSRTIDEVREIVSVKSNTPNLILVYASNSEVSVNNLLDKMKQHAEEFLYETRMSNVTINSNDKQILSQDFLISKELTRRYYGELMRLSIYRDSAISKLGSINYDIPMPLFDLIKGKPEFVFLNPTEVTFIEKVKNWYSGNNSDIVNGFSAYNIDDSIITYKFKESNYGTINYIDAITKDFFYYNDKNGFLSGRWYWKDLYQMNAREFNLKNSFNDRFTVGFENIAFVENGVEKNQYSLLIIDHYKLNTYKYSSRSYKPSIILDVQDDSVLIIGIKTGNSFRKEQINLNETNLNEVEFPGTHSSFKEYFLVKKSSAPKQLPYYCKGQIDFYENKIVLMNDGEKQKILNNKDKTVIKNITVLPTKSGLYFTNQPYVLKKYDEKEYGIFVFGENGDMDTILPFGNYNAIEVSHQRNLFKITNIDDSIQYFDADSKTYSSKYRDASDYNAHGFAWAYANNQTLILNTNFKIVWKFDKRLITAYKFLDAYSRFSTVNIKKFPIEFENNKWVMWDLQKNVAIEEFGSIKDILYNGYSFIYKDSYDNEYCYDLITETRIKMDKDLRTEYIKLNYDINAIEQSRIKEHEKSEQFRKESEGLTNFKVGN